MSVINYAHVYNGDLVHGTLSDVDDTPKATWSYSENGERVTVEQAIDEMTFSRLWNWIPDSPLFLNHQIRDPETKIDPQACHIVMIVFDMDGEMRRMSFMIPVDEGGPEMDAWLEVLDIPEGHR